MRGKLLSRIILAFALLSLTALLMVSGMFVNYINNESEDMGLYVFFAKENIPEETVFKSVEAVKQYIGVKRIKKNDVVESAVKVRDVFGNKGVLNFLKSLLISESYTASNKEFEIFVDKKAITSIPKNEQILYTRVSANNTQYEDDDRIVSISLDYSNSVGAEVHKGDYVDIWAYKSTEIGANMQKVYNPSSKKIVGPVKIEKVKDAEGIEITAKDKKIPKAATFKLNERQIEILAKSKGDGEVFLVKYGSKPRNFDEIK